MHPKLQADEPTVKLDWGGDKLALFPKNITGISETLYD